MCLTFNFKIFYEILCRYSRGFVNHYDLARVISPFLNNQIIVDYYKKESPYLGFERFLSVLIKMRIEYEIIYLNVYGNINLISLFAFSGLIITQGQIVSHKKF